MVLQSVTDAGRFAKTRSACFALDMIGCSPLQSALFLWYTQIPKSVWIFLSFKLILRHTLGMPGVWRFLGADGRFMRRHPQKIRQGSLWIK